MPTTPEQARIVFLETELSAAQARIVVLDTEKKDKDEKISVLMARLKLFEDEQTKTIYDKYFPKQKDAVNDERSDTSHPRATCTNSAPGSFAPASSCPHHVPPTFCAHLPPRCLSYGPSDHCHAHCQVTAQHARHSPDPEMTSPASSTTLHVQISRLSDDIRKLHSAVNNLANTSVGQVITAKTFIEPSGPPDLIELDNSVVSMEEFIENPVDSASLPKEYLNVQLQTTQS